MIRSLLLSVLLGGGLFTASAQTVSAHVNTGLVLESMPGTAVADSLLRQYQDSLALGFEAIQNEFNEKFVAFRDEEAASNRTPKQSQALQEELQMIQQQVQVYQQESARMFEIRRGTYLNPLFTRVEETIAAYAKTNGIDVVFDMAVGNVMLFAKDEKDITEDVIEALKP